MNNWGNPSIGSTASFHTNEAFSIGSPWTSFSHYAVQRTGTTVYNWIDGLVCTNGSTPTGWNTMTISNSTDGDYDTGSQLTLGNGDIIYGIFDKVEVDANDYIIAYIGK